MAHHYWEVGVVGGGVMGEGVGGGGVVGVWWELGVRYGNCDIVFGPLKTFKNKRPFIL